MKKSFVIVILLVVVGLILGGIAFDRQRAKERQRIAAEKTAAEQAKDKVPPLPQWGALLPATDEAEVTGSAMCGFCYWREGGNWCNTVLQLPDEPGIVSFCLTRRGKKWRSSPAIAPGGTTPSLHGAH